jgi:heme A synthase
MKNRGKTPLLLILGLAGVALIGMTGAITALGDTLFPAESLAHGLEQDAEIGAHFLIRLRIYHPLIAILTGAYILFLIKHLRNNQTDDSSRKLGSVLYILILIQWTAGLVNVLLLAPVPIQIIHLFIADLIWISLVLFTASKLSTITDNKSVNPSPEAV